MTFAVPYTQVPGILFPAIPPPRTAELLALQFQLSQSQWWPPGILADAHKVQLSALLTHAARQIPFYAGRLTAGGWRPDTLISSEQFRRIPILQRAEAMQLGEDLCAREIPEEHGEVISGSTSGSTGRSLRFWTTEGFRRVQYASHLRLYLWHGWDFHRNLAAIRVDRERVAPPPEGKTFTGWGEWLTDIYPTGRCHLLSARSDVDQQLDWLEARRPAYLQTYPSLLSALLQHAASQGRDISYLQGIGTLAETVTPELRERTRATIGRPLVDVYSSQEMGYLAIQCPRHEHYHVQAENVVLEVLDEAGEPCRPGQIGRVVVTTLHNFAAPLIRYEIGDYAEVGEPCDCGRHLPTLKRIMGRSRNMLKKPNGETVWPHFGTAALHRCAPIRQFQIIQPSLEQIELHIVMDEPLTAEMEAGLKAVLIENLEYPFEITVRRREQIERGAGDKYEDFLSLI
jgi:phenylacetate-CoA ligase